jgi:hypothetical protein
MCNVVARKMRNIKFKFAISELAKINTRACLFVINLSSKNAGYYVYCILVQSDLNFSFV